MAAGSPTAQPQDGDDCATPLSGRDYWIVHEGWQRNEAIATAADLAGRTVRRVEQMFDEFVPHWRDNILIGRALKLYRDGAPQEEAVKKAGAAMRLSVEDVERAF